MPLKFLLGILRLGNIAMKDTSQASFAPGQKVGQGRYSLVRKLGAGGMGVVWLAQDERLGEEAALKFLPPLVQEDKEALAGLRKETVRAHRLAHPNIVRIHDFHEPAGETAFISMEYVQGKTLGELRHEHPGEVFGWEAVAPFVQQLCEALEYAHGEGIIHRDLKPHNVMVDHKGRLKLADFGIAAVVSDSLSRVSLQHSSSGTPAYMSPQQMNGEKPAATDDVYALGATLYHLLTGQPPFFRGNLAHQVLNTPPALIPARLQEFGITNPVPPEVCSVVLACLAKEPAQRPPSAKAVWSWLTAPVKSPACTVANTIAAPDITRAATQAEALPTSPAQKPAVEATVANTPTVAPSVVTHGVPAVPGQPDKSTDRLATENPIPPAQSTPKPKTSLFLALAACLLLLGVAGAWYFLKYQPAQERQRQIAAQQAQDTAEKKRQADEAETKRLAAEKLKQEAEVKRVAEEKAKQEAEAKRLADEQAQKDAAEKARLAGELKRLAEAKLAAEEEDRKAKAEKARLEAELKRLADEKALTEQKAKVVEAERLRKLQLKSCAIDGDLAAILELRAQYADQASWRDWLQMVNMMDAALKTQSHVLTNRYQKNFLQQKTKAESTNSIPFDMYLLATLYTHGIGVESNHVEAVKWYRKAAEQDFALAQNYLGICYQNGQGVPKDATETVRWYRKAAEQDFAMAQHNLGICYLDGQGVPKDEVEAVKWYRKAAEQEYAYAQNNIGYCYANGQGVPKDEVEAVKWYRKAAEQDSAMAQYNLGICYRGGYGVPKDEVEAIKWYRKAADQGNANAQRNLGYCYNYGQGVPKNEAEAVEWYRRAAEQNDAVAQNNLGYCYLNGKGIPKDEVEAIKLYRKAAEQNYASAQYNVGFCYEFGRGVVIDKVEAIHWYRKAAEQGNEDAKKRLAELVK